MAEKIQSSMILKIKEKLPVVLPPNYFLKMTLGTIMLGFGSDQVSSFLWRATTSSAPTVIMRLETNSLFGLQLKKAGHSILAVLLPGTDTLTWWECRFSDATFKSLLSKKQRTSQEVCTGDDSYFVSIPKKVLWLTQKKKKLSVHEVPIGEDKAELKRVGTIESHMLRDHKFIGHHGGRLMFALEKINRRRPSEYTIGAWNVKTKELELSRVEVPSALFEELRRPPCCAFRLPVVLGEKAYFHLAEGQLVAIDLNEMTSRQIGMLPQDFLREEIPGSLEKLESKVHRNSVAEMISKIRFAAAPTIIDESKSTITFCGKDILNNRTLCYTFWYGLPSLMTLCYYSLPDQENRECWKTVLCHFT